MRFRSLRDQRGPASPLTGRRHNAPALASTRPSSKVSQLGQGMTEYILLVALIAIAAIAAVKYFGSKTKEGFETAADAVGGVNQGMQQNATDKAKNVVVDQIKR